MALLAQRETALIDPVYMQKAVNETLHLGTVKIALLPTNSGQTGTAAVSMLFVPNDRLIFETRLDSAKGNWPLLALAVTGGDEGFVLTDRGVTVKAFQTSTGCFMPNSSVVEVTPATDRIQRTVFHLFNFPSFFSSTDYVVVTRDPQSERTSSVRCGCITLRADGWVITISATTRTWNEAKAIEDRGGWLITHVGEIVREDKSDYTSKAVSDLLSCLHHYLSFALGRWTGLAFPVGFDRDGKRVFEQWGMPLAVGGEWSGVSSWFDDRHGDALVTVFEGFWRLWHRPLWRKPLGETIYWYLGASNRGVGIGVDTGLIIAQTALELLAWIYCVRDRAMISEAAFKPRGLGAADKFRLLASSLGIPLELPKELKALHAKRGQKWTDSMDALTAVRNALVHPHDERDLPDGSYCDAWTLSMWLLDLMLLKLCGYNGSYANRLTPQRFAGQVDTVPWATTKT